MIISDALSSLTHKLQAAGLEDPLMESEFLVAAATGLSRAAVKLRASSPLEEAAQQNLRQWSDQRAERIPFAYVVGHQPFRDFDLLVSPAVLIPRPETEWLVEKVLESIPKEGTSLVAADVGTGSGAIALSMAAHPRIHKVYGLDLSEKALEIARLNAKNYDPSKRCHWLQSDLLDELPAREPMDLIIANLPYIRTQALEELSLEVQCEPRLALDGGEEGLDAIFRLTDQAMSCLRPGGRLWLEIGFDQAEAVQKQLSELKRWTGIRVENDLSGLPRIVSAELGAI
jgi:release factor glutamine methyltransferase